MLSVEEESTRSGQHSYFDLSPGLLESKLQPPALQERHFYFANGLANWLKSKTDKLLSIQAEVAPIGGMGRGHLRAVRARKNVLCDAAVRRRHIQHLLMPENAPNNTNIQGPNATCFQITVKPILADLSYRLILSTDI